MKSIKIFCTGIKVFIALTLLSGCGEETLHILDSSETVPPPLEHATIERLPGALAISYTIPPSDNLLYVEAEVIKSNGEVLRVRSSYYNRSLLLQGFGDTAAYPIKLYSVGRNMKRSAALEIVGKPHLPAIWDVYKSLVVNEDFGGLNFEYSNQYQENVGIMIYIQNAAGEWKSTQNFYTSQATGVFSLRGLPANKQTFGFVVKDRWGNETAMLTKELTPLYEERIPASGFRQMFANLPTEAPGWQGGSVMSNLWSGVFVGTTNSQAWYRTDERSGIPHHFTFDMGKTAKLSRFVYWQRGAFDREDLLYTGGSTKTFEIWGSTNPDPGGSFQGWTLLRTCDVIKPSGLPAGSVSTDDVSVAQSGHEFSFDLDAESVRYIRIKVLETWGKTAYSWMSELQFYGQIN
ncbi:DUF5126 domain-containing protein [Sphingobacterium olei]|uniref:DUF5126 domain-containing protein n=1 Tax=Sphingobacterium olei TaxID=2571155 RepID=A0A4U0P684_9SPHI|nr:DUF5000 domain-containing lipoprotein [Sphingobacterium olei]TJZ62935.1 DUF5126 domain-containing protein [Sphingobacterium olei]